MSLIDLHFTDKLFESYYMYFKIPLTDPKCASLKVDSTVEYEGEIFYIIDVGDARDENGVALKTIQAEARWMRLTDRKKVGTFELLAKTPLEGLELILANTGWTVLECTVDTTPRTISADDATVTELLWKWARTCLCEIKFDNRAKTVSMLTTIGTVRDAAFRYALNLETIRRNSLPPVFTRLYPIGLDSLSISSVNGGIPYLEDFTYYTSQGMSLPDAQEFYMKEEVFNDTTIVDANNLLDRAQLFLDANSGIRITYAADVIDISSLLHEDAEQYVTGDTVGVYDEPTSTDTFARVTLTDKWPSHPDNNKIELSFSPVLPPDLTSSSRSNLRPDWELFHSRNDQTLRQVRLGSTILNRIKLRAREGAEMVVGYKLSGVGVGTGTITIEPQDDENLENIWSTHTLDVVDGEWFEFEFTFSRKEVPSGTYIFVVRAHSSGSGVGINIAAGDTAFWVLARNMVRENVTLENSIRFDYTGAVQYWDVPDDVSEALIEAHGARGSGTLTGLGGMVKAMFPVVGGTRLAVWVGGRGISPTGGWPNGGEGMTSNNNGDGGGASSSVTPDGSDFDTMFLSSLLVAPGGGGEGSNDIPFNDAGPGTFYGGTPSDAHMHPGSGATQTAGGVGIGGSEPGDTDGQGYGGDGFALGATLHSEGGGGGGGWHGGGSGGSDSNSRGGGGGAGMIDDTAWDLEIQDAENNGHGYVIISWTVPETGV